MPPRRCRAGLTALHGKVCAAGGFTGSLRVKTANVYDAALDQRSTCDLMEARRSTLGVAVLGNCIYAVGSFDGSTGLNTDEMFDPMTQKWRPDSVDVDEEEQRRSWGALRAFVCGKWRFFTTGV